MEMPLIWNSRRFLPCLIVGALLCLPAGALQSRPASAAPEAIRIAAVVNDDLISLYDLITQLDIVIASSKLKDSPELRRQLAPQVLRAMIDNRLQAQEGKRLKVVASEADIAEAVKRIETQNELPAGGFDDYLRARNLDRNLVIEQIGNDISWGKLVRRKLGDSATVSDDEVDTVAQRLQGNKGRPEYHLAEIVLTLDDPAQADAVRQTAENLVRELRQGASFSGTARQFSQSATAGQGGEIGWLVAGELPAEFEAALAKAKPGDVTEPLRGSDGFHILMLIDRRTVLSGDPGGVRFHLVQVVFNATQSMGAEQQSAMQILRMASTKGCPAFLDAARGVASPLSGDLGTVLLRDLPADLRVALTDLKAGQVTRPLPFQDGERIIMVCQRTQPPAPTIDRDAIRNDLVNRRVEGIAQRYLRDLRRAAFIDIRLK